MNVPVLSAVIISALSLVVIMQGRDVRLVLFAASLLLAGISGHLLGVFDVFFARLGDANVIGPICSAMGFSFVIRKTGCDREMVRALLRPLQGMTWLLIPGGFAVGFLTNMAITSQTAAAAAVGPILAPLMSAAGFSPVTTAATLILGCSAGGNLFNPGEPDVVNINVNTGVSPYHVISSLALPELAAVIAALLLFVSMELFRERRRGVKIEAERTEEETAQSAPIDILKALLPPLPVILLFSSMPSLGLFPAVGMWYPGGPPVVHVMVFSTILTMIVTRYDTGTLTSSFFEGMGYGFTNVISLIVVASCFIESLRLCGVIDTLIHGIATGGAWGYVSSAFSTFALAIVSGSGTAPSIAFSKGVLPGLIARGMDVSSVVDLGMLGAIGATFGRTMSPVAAVVIFAATLTGCRTNDVVRRLSIPLAIGLVVAILATLQR